MIFTLPKQKLT